MGVLCDNTHDCIHFIILSDIDKHSSTPATVALHMADGARSAVQVGAQLQEHRSHIRWHAAEGHLCGSEAEGLLHAAIADAPT